MFYFATLHDAVAKYDFNLKSALAIMVKAWSPDSLGRNY